MKKLVVALAATFTLLSAQPKTQPKEFERYFLPTNGDTITIHNTDSMKVFLKNKGWDGKTFESLMKTINDIDFEHGDDSTDNNITWEDATNYGGFCIVGSTFIYTALKTAGLNPVFGVVRAAFVKLDKQGNVIGLSAGIVSEPTSHMICFVDVDGKVYAGSEEIGDLDSDIIDPAISSTVWDFAEGYKNVVVYPLMIKWPSEIEHGTNVVDNYLRYKFKHGLFVKINTDGFKPEDWEKVWLDAVEHLKKGYVIIFTRGEPRW